MDLALWEKVKRYRRIAAFASDEEAARQTKPTLRLGGEKISAEKQENRPGKTSTAG